MVLQVDDTFIDALACNTELLTLNLSQTAVTNKGLLTLFKRVPRITTLIADGCQSLQGSIPGLCALVGLSNLSFSGCRDVSAADVLLSISSATRLTKLNLSWCRGERSCNRDPTRAVAVLQGLQVLLLDNAALPDPVAALHAALGLRSITQLSMSGFTFPDCTEHSLCSSDGDADSGEDDVWSQASATIAASWPGGELAQVTSHEPRNMRSFGHPAARMYKRLDFTPRPSRLTMLTLWSSNVRLRALFILEIAQCDDHATLSEFSSSLLRLLRLWVRGRDLVLLCSCLIMHGSLWLASQTWSTSMLASRISATKRCRILHL